MLCKLRVSTESGQPHPYAPFLHGLLLEGHRIDCNPDTLSPTTHKTPGASLPDALFHLCGVLPNRQPKATSVYIRTIPPRGITPRGACCHPQQPGWHMIPQSLAANMTCHHWPWPALAPRSTGFCFVAGVTPDSCCEKKRDKHAEYPSPPNMQLTVPAPAPPCSRKPERHSASTAPARGHDPPAPPHFIIADRARSST